jgi:AAA15 family ATPase/GTPase
MARKGITLTNVKLSGYKTIQHCDVDFKPGINIIIGKNGVGKTNFMKFLFNVLNFRFDDLLEFKSEVTLESFTSKTDVLEVVSERRKRKSSSKELSYGTVSNSIKLNDKIQKLPNPTELPLQGAEGLWKFDYQSSLTEHSINWESFLIGQTEIGLTFKNYLSEDKKLIDVIFGVEKVATPFFCKSEIAPLVFSNKFKFNQKNFPSEDVVRNNVLEQLNVFVSHFNNHTSFLPIQSIRVSPGVYLQKGNVAEGDFSINGLKYEYKVHDKWHLFHELSDGTKRILFIAFDVLASRFYRFGDKFLSVAPTAPFNRIILIEEPELGLHPHQLSSLLDFLKEKSSNTQFIITTHSPQVLDTLNANELDKITIADYDVSKGTTMRKLTKAEITKAKAYMKHNFLSDYWRLSDLEK